MPALGSMAIPSTPRTRTHVHIHTLLLFESRPVIFMQHTHPNPIIQLYAIPHTHIHYQRGVSTLPLRPHRPFSARQLQLAAWRLSFSVFPLITYLYTPPPCTSIGHAATGVIKDKGRVISRPKPGGAHQQVEWPGYRRILASVAQETRSRESLVHDDLKEDPSEQGLDASAPNCLALHKHTLILSQSLSSLPLAHPVLNSSPATRHESQVCIKADPSATHIGASTQSP